MSGRLGWPLWRGESPRSSSEPSVKRTSAAEPPSAAGGLACDDLASSSALHLSPSHLVQNSASPTTSSILIQARDMLLDSKDRTQTNAPLAKGESRGFATETEVS
jgi:hypothetical protein